MNIIVGLLMILVTLYMATADDTCTAQTCSTLINGQQGLDKDHDALVVGLTNHAHSVSAALDEINKKLDKIMALDRDYSSDSNDYALNEEAEKDLGLNTNNDYDGNDSRDITV
eukprot:47870_1